MSDKLILLAERRGRLIAQAAAQRLKLAENLEPWHVPMNLASQGWNALRFIRNHPAFMGGSAVLLTALLPGRAGIWLRRGWVTWQIVHELRGSRQILTRR